MDQAPSRPQGRQWLENPRGADPVEKTRSRAADRIQASAKSPFGHNSAQKAKPPVVSRVMGDSVCLRSRRGLGFAPQTRRDPNTIRAWSGWYKLLESLFRADPRFLGAS